jgi:hypothetical protein
MARWFIQDENTAPIAPHNWSFGLCGNGLSVSSMTRAL